MRKGIVEVVVVLLVIMFGTGVVVVAQSGNDRTVAPIWLDEDCTPALEIVPTDEVHDIDLIQCKRTNDVDDTE